MSTAHNYETFKMSTTESDGLLLSAVKYGLRNMVLNLISSCANVNAKECKFFRTPLMIAALNGDVGMMRILLSVDSIDSTCCDKMGSTALILACKSNNEMAARLLIDIGSSLNTLMFDERFTKDRSFRTILQKLSSEIIHPTNLLRIREGAEIEWGFERKDSYLRDRFITRGWISNISPHTGVYKSYEEIFIKFGRNKEELEKELNVRSVLRSASTCDQQGRHKFVLQKLDRVVDVGNSWNAILLERGDIDLHYLLHGVLSNRFSVRHLSSWKHFIATSLCEILDAFNRKNLVWLDFKPANIIVFSGQLQHSSDENLFNNGKASLHSIFNQSKKKNSEYCYDIPEIVLKATDLTSTFEIGELVNFTSISCTAKFISPELAVLFQLTETNEDAIETKDIIPQDSQSKKVRTLDMSTTCTSAMSGEALNK